MTGRFKQGFGSSSKLTGTRRFVQGKKKDRGAANRINRRIAKRFWQKEII